MSQERDDLPDAPPEVVAVARYNELVTKNLRNTRVLPDLAEEAGARLTRATFEVLAVVHRHGPIRVSELVPRIGVDQSTISRQIRPLEELGLIARSEDPSDRRVVWLDATEAGQEMMLSIRRRVNRNVEAALASWSAADRETFGKLLERFRQSVLDLAAAQAFEAAAEASDAPTSS
jgi:DNA-binding MarR family transcriptional regulator